MSLLASISRNSVLLGLFAAATAAGIAYTWEATETDIERAIRDAEARKLLEIFPPVSHNNTLIDDRFTVDASTPLLGLRDTREGYTARVDGKIVGVILPVKAREGYSGDIDLLVGVNADGSVAGVRVISHRETPGLGDAVDLRKSPWILDFNTRSLNDPTPANWAVKKDGGVFDQFTGATITPRAVVDATRRALEYAERESQRLFDPLITPARPSDNSQGDTASE